MSQQRIWPKKMVPDGVLREGGVVRQHKMAVSRLEPDLMADPVAFAVEVEVEKADAVPAVVENDLDVIVGAVEEGAELLQPLPSVVPHNVDVVDVPEKETRLRRARIFSSNWANSVAVKAVAHSRAAGGAGES